jgi:hypothetical protein
VLVNNKLPAISAIAATGTSHADLPQSTGPAELSHEGQGFVPRCHLWLIIV